MTGELTGDLPSLQLTQRIVTFFKIDLTNSLSSQQIKAAEEAIDKAIQHADKLHNTTQTQERAIIIGVSAVSAELEEASSSLRKLEEKEENMRKTKKKIDCDALPESVEVIVVEVVNEKERRTEAAVREALYRRINDALVRKNELVSKLKVTNELKCEQKTTVIRLYMQRVHSNAADSKKYSLLPAIAQSVRVRTSVQLQCIISGCVEGKELPTAFTAIIKDLTPPPSLLISSPTSAVQSDVNQITDTQRVEALLDVSRVAGQLGQRESAQQSYDAAIKIGCTVSPIIRIKTDLCKALQLAALSSTGWCCWCTCDDLIIF